MQTHEQLVDLAWKPAFEPLLRSRFPGITPESLKEAHAYAYGGCAILDLGYYPFGNAFFSDLTHYVRPGDFIQSLLRNAKTPNDLAFALGALTHFVGDSNGHSIAVNTSVAKDFPRLEARYGPSVPYDVSPHSHIRTEFAFDINEISKHRFAPSAYLRHVGLEVAGPLLDKAFYETYGMHAVEILGGRREKPTLRGYRFSVRSFLPRIAYAETLLHRHSMPPDVSNEDFQKFESALKQSDFENGWDQFRKKAGPGTYSLAALIAIMPRIGPLADLAIKVPDIDTEQSYVRSVNVSVERIGRDVADLQARNTARLTSDLQNRDLDTGLKVAPGTYRLTDETYAKLVHRLVTKDAKAIPAGLVVDINSYYADPNAPIATKKHPAKWEELQKDLATLQTLPTVPEP